MHLRVVRKTFGPKRDEIGAARRKLHNEERHNLYSSPNKISMMKSRWMKRAGHVLRTGQKRNTFKILVTEPEGKIHYEAAGIDVKIILKLLTEI
jgi:hypothetical protein